jgi:hypothetical protein
MKDPENAYKDAVGDSLPLPDYSNSKDCIPCPFTFWEWRFVLVAANHGGTAGAWSRENSMTDPGELWRGIEAALVGFLLVELDLGMTFARAAMDATGSRERLRNRRLARSTYDTVVRLGERAKPTGPDTAKLAAKTSELKSALRGLGDPL